MNLNDLATFVAVVDHGTITAAAAAEGVPKSTISRRLTRLEQTLGVALLTRSSRSFAVTEVGRRLHARAKPAVEELNASSTSVRETDEPRGTLVLSAPHDFGRAWFFVDLLATYRDRYPKVRLEVRLETRYVDLVLEGVDVALRGHIESIPGDPTLMTRTVGASRIGMFAGAGYLARAGRPTHAAQLEDHPLIAHTALAHRSLTLRSTEGEEVGLDLSRASVEANDFSLVRALAGADAGIAILPVFESSPEPDSTLERILHGWTMTFAKLSLVWPAARFIAPSVRAFIDLATERLGCLEKEKENAEA